MVFPSAAITSMVMAFGPTAKGRLCDAVPEFTAVPFTRIVADGSTEVGVTVIDVVANPTLAV